MNEGNNQTKKQRITTSQFIIATLLLLLPLTMLWYNGQRAIKGIFWDGLTTAQHYYPLTSNDAEEVNSADAIQSSGKRFGIYDPSAAYVGLHEFTIEQIYISWSHYDQKQLRGHLEEIINRNRNPMLVIEPWTGDLPSASLLEDITLGKYNDEIDGIIQSLSGLHTTVYISWGHEMDQELTERYPWSGSIPEAYIEAYRYVYKRITESSYDNLKWIWSPVGNHDCQKYWPGAGYADFVGFPVYSYPNWDRQYFGYIRSFSSWFSEKYAAVQSLNKAVFIVEMGVTGPDEYQELWLREAFSEIQENAAISAVIIFNAQDTPGVWGKNVNTPDWRTGTDHIISLIKAAQQN